MSYTLGDAAKATGKSKSTIKRALDSGRISGKKNEIGVWEIDPAELHRVFQQVDRGTVPDRNTMERENTLLREQLEREREINRSLEQDRDHWRQQATSLLSDQRKRARPVGLWQWFFQRQQDHAA